MKYTATVEAKQFYAGRAREIALFAGLGNLIGYVDDQCVVLKTVNGPAIASLGDYVTVHNGQVAVVKREVFETMFAPAEA